MELKPRRRGVMTTNRQQSDHAAHPHFELLRKFLCHELNQNISEFGINRTENGLDRRYGDGYAQSPHNVILSE